MNNTKAPKHKGTMNQDILNLQMIKLTYKTTRFNILCMEKQIKTFESQVFEAVLAEHE